MGCEGYEAIAKVYDKLNADINYSAWADFVEECFAKFLPQKPELVLDLACGKHHGQRTDVVSGNAVLDGSHAACVGRDVSAKAN